MGYEVKIGLSNKHLHLSQEHIEALFGKGHELTPTKDLVQPGQFACAEKVKVVGPKGDMTMSILGPFRNACQVEIALTDARKLGVAAPVRESGDIEGTPGCKLVGPCGEYDIDKGVIAAKRHIHFTPENAKECGVEDKQIVSVKIDTNGRSLVFGDVVVRVSEKFAPAMHIDTDESNAAGIVGTVDGEIIL